MTYQGVVLKQGGSMDPNVQLREISKIDTKDVVAFSKKWLKTGRFEWFITGNIKQVSAVNMVESTQKIMDLQTLQKQHVLEQRTINLPAGHTYNFSYDLKDETNSAVLLYYQHETLTMRSQLVNEIIANLMKSPFFQQLRTQEQLGYAVFSMVSDIRGITGFNFLIQSNGKSPQYCQDRIKKFIGIQMMETMRALTAEEF